jgi:hypothetical protein
MNAFPPKGSYFTSAKLGRSSGTRWVRSPVWQIIGQVAGTPSDLEKGRGVHLTSSFLVALEDII